MLRATAVVSLFVLLAASIVAQSKGILKGRLEDPAGAAIHKAQVSVKGEGGSFTTVSDENGDYGIVIPEGVYQIKIAKLPGFAAYQSGKVRTRAGATVSYIIRPKIDLSSADCVLRVTPN